MAFGRVGFAPMSLASQPDMRWHPERPRLRPLRLVISWVISALSLLFAALVVPNVTVSGFWGALGIAALIAILNALVPPVIAALRLPFTLISSFLLILFADAALLLLASDAFPGRCTSPTWAGRWRCRCWLPRPRW
jgi:putative membrane protein